MVITVIFVPDFSDDDSKISQFTMIPSVDTTDNFTMLRILFSFDTCYQRGFKGLKNQC